MLRAARTYKRAISRVYTNDIIFCELDGEVAIQVVQKVGDILSRGGGIIQDAGSGIGGAKDSAGLPGNNKEDALIISLRQHDGVIAEIKSLACKYQVDPLAWFYLDHRPAARHLLDLFGMHACCIDHVAGANGEFAIAQ